VRYEITPLFACSRDSPTPRHVETQVVDSKIKCPCSKSEAGSIGEWPCRPSRRSAPSSMPVSGNGRRPPRTLADHYPRVKGDGGCSTRHAFTSLSSAALLGTLGADVRPGGTERRADRRQVIARPRPRRGSGGRQGGAGDQRRHRSHVNANQPPPGGSVRLHERHDGVDAAPYTRLSIPPPSASAPRHASPATTSRR